MIERTKLSAGRRILRGFHRIGLAIGACVLLAGIAAMTAEGYKSRERSVEQQKQAQCMLDNPKFGTYLRSSEILFPSEIGCPGPMISKNADDYYKIGRTKPLSIQSAMFDFAVEYLWIFWLVAAGCYVLFAGIGWIISGFSSDPDMPPLY